MIPQKFEGANKAFTAPQGISEEEVGTLPVRETIVKFPMTNGQDFITRMFTSAWKPDEEDLKRLNAGGVVYLDIYSDGHPVVCVSTEITPVDPIDPAINGKIIT